MLDGVLVVVVGQVGLEPVAFVAVAVALQLDVVALQPAVEQEQ